MTEESRGMKVMQGRRSWLRDLSRGLGYVRDATPSEASEERDVLEQAIEIVERRTLEVNREIGMMAETARERRG